MEKKIYEQILHREEKVKKWRKKKPALSLSALSVLVFSRGPVRTGLDRPLKICPVDRTSDELRLVLFPDRSGRFSDLVGPGKFPVLLLF